MANINTKIDIKLSVTLTLTEAEAGFLEGISGFEPEDILLQIRKVCGTGYTEDIFFKEHPEDGFLSLMKKCRSDLSFPLKQIKKLRRSGLTEFE